MWGGGRYGSRGFYIASAHGMHRSVPVEGLLVELNAQRVVNYNCSFSMQPFELFGTSMLIIYPVMTVFQLIGFFSRFFLGKRVGKNSMKAGRGRFSSLELSTPSWASLLLFSYGLF